jgi:hypothetical protein
MGRVFRVEVEVERVGADEVQYRVRLLTLGPSGAPTRVTLDLPERAPWTMVPTQLRESFVRENQRALTFELYRALPNGGGEVRHGPIHAQLESWSSPSPACWSSRRVPWLCHFCQTTLIPLVRDRVGAGAREVADGPGRVPRPAGPHQHERPSSARGRPVQKHVLGVKTTYAKTGPSTATAKTEMVRSRGGEQGLPPRRRAVSSAGTTSPTRSAGAMIQKNKQAGVVDQKKVFEQRLSQRAEEEQMLDLIQ